MYYVYALISKVKDRIYVGLTKNLNSRIKDHNSGRTKSTKYYKPWIMFYYENFENRLEARQREKKLKTGSGKEFLKKVLRDAPVASAFGGQDATTKVEAY